MAQYRDDNDNRVVDEATGLPIEHMLRDDDDEDVIAGERRAFSAWNVIGAGIVIVLIATASLALWPSQATDPTSTASTTPVVPAEPAPDAGNSGQGQ